MKNVKGGSAPATHQEEEHINTGNRKTLQCDKIKIRMRNTISEVRVKYCTCKRIIDGEKENNTKQNKKHKTSHVEIVGQETHATDNRVRPN